MNKPSLVIALDWDETFTADPNLWALFMGIALGRGHKVVVITARLETDPVEFDRYDLARYDIPVVYAGYEWKKYAAEQAGYNVDIWIDDAPGFIEPQRKLQDNSWPF